MNTRCLIGVLLQLSVCHVASDAAAIPEQLVVGEGFVQGSKKGRGQLGIGVGHRDILVCIGLVLVDRWSGGVSVNRRVRTVVIR